MKFSGQDKFRPTYYVEYDAEDGGVRFFDPFAVRPDQLSNP